MIAHAFKNISLSHPGSAGRWVYLNKLIVSLQRLVVSLRFCQLRCHGAPGLDVLGIQLDYLIIGCQRLVNPSKLRGDISQHAPVIDITGMQICSSAESLQSLFASAGKIEGRALAAPCPPKSQSIVSRYPLHRLVIGNYRFIVPSQNAKEFGFPVHDTIFFRLKIDDHVVSLQGLIILTHVGQNLSLAQPGAGIFRVLLDGSIK